VLLPDVNVLLYAHREDSHPEHPRYAAWTGVVRIATSSRIFPRPSRLAEVLDFTAELVRQPMARLVGPGPRHWELVTELCRQSGASGKLVADAAHAAVALENGCTFVTTDSDFGRFPGLRHRHPLSPAA
jgi:toxin-antitoxin system PIN domain toxin